MSRAASTPRPELAVGNQGPSAKAIGNSEAPKADVSDVSHGSRTAFALRPASGHHLLRRFADLARVTRGWKGDVHQLLANSLLRFHAGAPSLQRIETLRPTEPIELLMRLQTFFPGFGDDELMREVGEGERGFHGIMLEFSGEFRAEKATDAQLSGLVELIEQAVTIDDEIENAIATCFLEHLHQIDRSNLVYRRLSPEARRRTRA